ncbi:MAG: hypothetical protein ACOWWH_01345 [Eubacteriaceae bacterium]
MARTARQKSATGIYHIVLRGVNRQIIFEDDEDKEKFLQTLLKYKDTSGYKKKIIKYTKLTLEQIKV